MGTTFLDPNTPDGWRDAVLRHAVTPAQLQGITDAQLESVYSLACREIAQGRFEGALDHAAFVAQHNPWERRYLFVFALCLQHLGDLEAAARFYGEALLLDATDAVCAYRIGECLGAVGELDDAREAFEMAVKLSWLDAQGVEVREQAQRRLDELVALGA